MKDKKTRFAKKLVLLTATFALVATTMCTGVSARESTQASELYVGGMPFGVKFYTEGITVVGYSDIETEKGGANPARDAGVKIHDTIIKVNGKSAAGSGTLIESVENCNGGEVVLTVKRASRGGSASEHNITIRPVKGRGETKYRSGLLVRDSGAGIGTVTYIDPATKSFAGLGHGICDGETGELVPIERGTVTNVTISGIKRGVAGDPGALHGYFNPGRVGTLLGNTVCGVYGILTQLPDSAGQLVKVGTKSDIHDGKATVRCTLDTGEIGEYEINISSINRNENGSKCFTVTVTDPKLIEKTGGIVQGMSGSPIIQDGKLVGAVTHVMINQPTVGYGIFIENMLTAGGMKRAEQLPAA